MSTVQARPSFTLTTELSEQELKKCLRQAFAQPVAGAGESAWQSRFQGNHAMISIDETKRHFWSPWLHLELGQVDGKHLVHGRFSPHPSIWTGFMFSWLALAVLVFFGGILGVSQQLSGQTPWGYYIIPVCLGLAFLLWIASRIGQRLADEEMHQMKSRLAECVGCPEEG